MTIRLPSPIAAKRRASASTTDDAASFAARVLSVVRRIPAGRVSTYGDVAEMAGRPRAARAVGNIMRDCQRRDVPCHRVVAAGGRLGGYGGRETMKRSLLAAEGVVMRGQRIPMDVYGWFGRSSSGKRE
ncbi:MAG: MGMT family protein [Vicinamibacterales bacterium]